MPRLKQPERLRQHSAPQQQVTPSPYYNAKQARNGNSPADKQHASRCARPGTVRPSPRETAMPPRRSSAFARYRRRRETARAQSWRQRHAGRPPGSQAQRRQKAAAAERYSSSRWRKGPAVVPPAAHPPQRPPMRPVPAAPPAGAARSGRDNVARPHAAGWRRVGQVIRGCVSEVLCAKRAGCPLAAPTALRPKWRPQQISIATRVARPLPFCLPQPHPPQSVMECLPRRRVDAARRCRKARSALPSLKIRSSACALVLKGRAPRQRAGSRPSAPCMVDSCRQAGSHARQSCRPEVTSHA